MLVQVEIATDLADDLRAHWPLAYGKGAEQGIITDHTDDTGNTARRLVDELHGIRREELPYVSTCDTDTGVDVEGSFT